MLSFITSLPEEGHYKYQGAFSRTRKNRAPLKRRVIRGIYMLSSFLNSLSAEIVIEVSPDRFVFKRDSETKILSTKIYLSDCSAKAVALGFGDEFMATQSNICIELFRETNTVILQNVVKAECFNAFFRHAFRAITRRTAMIRPRVVFQNTKSLNKILCGYQKSILTWAAINAGARECIFEN